MFVICVLFLCTEQTNIHNKEQAHKHITKKTPKNTKENGTGTKHKWESYKVRPHKEKEATNQKAAKQTLKNSVALDGNPEPEVTSSPNI
jgi:hypothetical protein